MNRSAYAESIRVFSAGNAGIGNTPIDIMLGRLDGVKQIRPDRWQARCSAHDDRSPSLAISETPDGTILLKCWAGCAADAIVRALGLELKDLFPPRFDYQATSKGKAPRYSASEVVKTAVTEATIIALGYRALQRGEELSQPDQGRVELAIGALDNLREVTR
jgi:hypothetical protein